MTSVRMVGDALTATAGTFVPTPPARSAGCDGRRLLTEAADRLAGDRRRVHLGLDADGRRLSLGLRRTVDAFAAEDARLGMLVAA